MADYQYITASGVIIPDTAGQRTAVENAFRAVFGQDLDVSPETPQGALITMETENRDAVARNNAELANQINPDMAGGVFLDALWALMGGQRWSATRSVLPQAQFGGVPGTIIPAGSLAETRTGDKFATTRALIIGKSGSTTGDLRAVETGPVACPAGHLNKVASSVLGWETVSNAMAAVPGRTEESDFKSRRRRKLTLARNTISVTEAIASALYELEGVRSLACRENYTDAPLTLDGITLVPHSVYVCVDGGESGEIAAALLRTKTIGAAWNGREEVAVTEPVSGQVYQVRFDRAKPVVLFCRVTVKKTALDAQNIIPAAVAAWAAGDTEADDGLVTGRDVSPFEIAAGVNAAEPRLFVTRVELSVNGTDWSPDTFPVKLNEIADIRHSAVQVVFV